jgi:hypothetical protein
VYYQDLKDDRAARKAREKSLFKWRARRSSSVPSFQSDRSLHSTVRCGLAPRLIPAWISVCGLFSFDNHVHLVAGSVKPTMSFQGRLFNLLDEGSTTTTSTKTRTDSRRTFLVLPQALSRPKPTTPDKVPSAPGLFRCEHGFMNHCGGILLGRPSFDMDVSPVVLCRCAHAKQDLATPCKR